ncbi:Gfo/Idh/MocA family oxidoreductase [Gilvimarinus sp. SDUM040013]|uniref:Gfo/Idh/MocA family oxidoreductase n=1 Tax=Gilvimarinus gilvus TaxID=3058038 RepID=A0ABU4RXQ3_9GAMM|nr:Gfo/Idh/MocA family oxidoreductase [Gilvimarinus sp. SDUM040013]MDO3387317.1 Gfo/Idh/MocA family oxidoreductase [Gilvimarinus sp. SDUM040013]MDX6849006.1 Gfo/Idh/MocA family oxidoreductase [Gilvimarinus sp. SDUM040013]
MEFPTNMNSEAKNQPLRTALIGGGINSAVGRVHDVAMRMDHKFDLVAGCFSRDKEVNERSGKSFCIENSRVYDNLKQLLDTEKDNLDVVVVALPTDQHANAIFDILDYGINVITDKPTVSTVEQALQLKQKLENNKKQVFTLFNYTCYPMVKEMRSMLAQGKLGKIHRAMIEMPQDSFLRMRNESTPGNIQQWRLSDGEICGASLDLFTHIHSLMKFLNPAKPVSAFANMRSISQLSAGLIDDVDALIDYDDGSTLSAWYGKAALGYRNGLQVRIFGELGTLEWVQMKPEALIFSDQSGETHLLDRLSPEAFAAQAPNINRFKAGHPAGFIEAFANCYYDIAQTIQHGSSLENPTFKLESAIEGLELARALQTSHTTGNRYDF